VVVIVAMDRALLAGLKRQLPDADAVVLEEHL
jgi:hypothetical protein